MKRLLTSTVLFLCCVAISFARFTGTVSDAQGVKYTANGDESTCYVSGHEKTYSATIIIPDVYEGRTVTSIGVSAFSGCSGLTSLIIPEGVTEIGDKAFDDCSSLMSVTVINPQPIEISSYTFYGQNAILIVPKGSKALYEGAEGWNRFKTIVEPFDGTLSDSQGVKYSANSDDWTCRVSGHETSYNHDITIPEIYEGRVVTSIVNDAFSGCNDLTSLTIPSSLISIGDNAFHVCNNLECLDVNWTTPLEITAKVFENSNYQNATLYVPIGSEDAYKTSSVWKNFKEILVLFKGTAADSQGIKYTANDNRATCYVSGHEDTYSTTIEIPETFGGRKVTSIGGSAFRGCSGLTLLTIPESVTSIGESAFRGCSGLTLLTIPESVTSIGESAFSVCSGLTSLTISEGVTSIGEGAFAGCSGLTSLTIPEGVTSIGRSAFSGCSGLTSLTISEGVTSIGNIAFDGCSSLTSLTIPSSVKSIGSSAFYNCSGLTSLTISEGVTSIGGWAFDGCSSLTSLTIPSSVKSIGSSTFSNCCGLTTIVVDENNTVYDSRDNCNAIINTSDNTLIRGCQNTVIPSSVTSIGYSAFYGCSSLTSLVIPSSVTSIGDYAFSGCSGLISIVVDENNTVYDSRDDCNAIINTSDNTLIAGCQNTIIPSSVTSIGDYAFSRCSGLTSLTIPEGVTSIGREAFLNCSSLTSLTIPEGVTEIGGSTFYGCSSLTPVTIPEGVTSIGGWAFYGCSSLTSLTIPSSVTSIGYETFYGCSNLAEVYCYGEIVPTTGLNAFNRSFIGTATLYVPASALDDYKTTEPWSRFKNIVSMGEFLTIGETGMATLYSTWDLDFTEVSGVKAYIASVFNRQTGELTLTRVNDVPARTGLLIKGEPGTYAIPWKESFSIVSNLLRGVTEVTNINATEDGYVNYVLNNGSQGVGFYKVGTAGASLEAGRAYLQIPAETALSRSALKLRFDDEGEATAISDVECQKGETAVYDLQGRRVEQPRRGLYISNGKKVIIK